MSREQLGLFGEPHEEGETSGRRHRWGEEREHETKGRQHWDTTTLDRVRVAECEGCKLLRVRNPKGNRHRWTTYYRGKKRLDVAGPCASSGG